MTNLSDNRARWLLQLSAVLGWSLGCVSLEPLSSYSEGERGVQEPAPASESSQAAVGVEQSLPAEQVVDVSEGPPLDGELVLEPVAMAEPVPVEPELGPTCTGLGEFPDAEGTTCYLRSTANAGWTEAQTSCRAWGGGLVVVDSAEEDQFLGTHLDATFWIGASDLIQEGRVLWNGGAPIAFSHWAMGEPNDYQGREDCVVKTMPDGSWNDVPCRNLNAYVCERSED
jgi:hypothetical protein